MLEVAAGVVAKLGDLLVGIDFAEFVIRKLGSAEEWVREDVDRGEAVMNFIEGTERDDAVFGDRVMVGIGFKRITPVNTVGDSGGEEERGMSGKLKETVSGLIEEKMMAVGGLKLHNSGLDTALTLLQSIACDANFLIANTMGIGFAFILQIFDYVFYFY